MIKSIDINAFSGMNTVKQKERLFVADGVAEPATILNADVTDAGRLEIRGGTTLRTSLSGANSLWAGTFCMLCCAGNTLYKISQHVASSIGSVANVSEQYPLSYAEAENKVYMSNRYWQGVYDPITGTFGDWGIPLPPGPMVLATTGNLPAGIYHLCFVTVSGSDISGNGQITKIELSSEGGIQVLNRPAGAITCITDPNESIFYPAGTASVITGMPDSVEPLPSFLCSPPPYMENLCFAFGRIWGSVGGVLYYSEPGRFGWFKQQMNKFEFESDITLVAQVTTGLFVGTDDHTWFLSGNEPQKMSQVRAGAGSVKGTLAYCNNLPELGDVLGTPEKGYVDVPVWRTKEGIVAGNTSGRLFNLSKGKVALGDTGSGASLYMDSGDGVFKFITSARHDGSISAVEDGRVFTPGWAEEKSSKIGFSDSATCEVRRGGVLI